MTEFLASLNPALAGAISGLLAGVIGSLVAPWVHWSIEKRRSRLKARAAMIREVRECLHEPPSREEFRLMPLYAQLRTYLSQQTREEVEKDDTVRVVVGGRHTGVNPYAARILDEIAKLEREWNLI